ncbi:MAG: DUF427 domain-containing protein [Gammaproteobacteria bacterium]|nr:DUF427 domain-containing protein [Gammaproteobacteria bacterium]
MTEAAVRERVTLARETIHNPQEPRHFMRVKPVNGCIRILRDGKLLAESEKALRVLEAGRDLYDPVLYLPREDVVAKLVRADKRTHCPLKGQASYFDLYDDNNRVQVAEVAWSYETSFDFASELKERIAFDAKLVVIEEHPAAA